MKSNFDAIWRHGAIVCQKNLCRYLLPFEHNARTWQADRQTDRQRDRQTDHKAVTLIAIVIFLKFIFHKVV